MAMSPEKPNSSATADRNITGILFLKNLEKPENSFEWYSSKIAGVPFILRNLLTLKRSGLKTLAVFVEDPSGDLQNSFKEILKDRRLSQDIIWLGDINQLIKWIQNNPDPIYIFNGSVLHDKKELYQIIHTKIHNWKAPVFPVNPENLQYLLSSDPKKSIIQNSNVQRHVIPPHILFAKTNNIPD